MKPSKGNTASVIALEGMEFFSYHGCIKEERVIGTKFNVDLFLQTDTSKAEESDNLLDTVNYYDVYQLVKKEMDTRSDLLEHVCRRILNVLLAKYEAIQSATINIKKLNPPLGGKIESVSLTISETNGKD